SASRCPIARATTSLTPPAAAVTTMVMVLAGEAVCACAAGTPIRLPTESAIDFSIVGSFAFARVTRAIISRQGYHASFFRGYRAECLGVVWAPRGGNPASTYRFQPLA